MRTTSLFSMVGIVAGLAACAPDVDDTWDFADGKGDGGGSISYGALALSKAPPALAAVVTGLAVIDDDVLPHEAKAVRKQIAELRDQVDLFVFAYSDKHGDPWKDLRDDLDTGYETIGAFKDLFDRQGVVDPADAVYDADELADRRDDVIAWTEAFLDPDLLAGYRDYLARPSQAALYDRDRDDLSPYFWGATKIEPSLSRSGTKNMAKLTRELVDLALDDYDAVLQLRDLHEPEHQEKFHSFRKRIRSIARMPGYFPKIVEEGEDLVRELEVVTAAVDRYGQLNDLITRYSSDPSGELEDEIKDVWKQLRSWQEDSDFDQVLDRIHDAIRH